jgi:hypothetical protein
LCCERAGPSFAEFNPLLTATRPGRRRIMTTRGKRAAETLYDKPLSSKGKLEVNLSTYAFLFSEIVQYSHGRVTSLSQLHEKLSDLGKHAGFRMIDVLCLREKTPKRETRLVNHLLYIQKTLWKTLFYKEADRLEQATASESTCIHNSYRLKSSGINCMKLLST